MGVMCIRVFFMPLSVFSFSFLMWPARVVLGWIGMMNVEYFIPMANTGPRGDSHHQLEGMFKKVRPAMP
jgi:hypothetical protein